MWSWRSGPCGAGGMSHVKLEDLTSWSWRNGPCGGGGVGHVELEEWAIWSWTSRLCGADELLAWVAPEERFGTATP